MEMLVLDQDFQVIDLAEDFESQIWTDRYCGFGDFEIYTPVDQKTFELLTPDRYIWSKESDRLMIIEDVEIVADADEGSRLKVTGRSIEALLERRIIWTQTVLTGNLQNGIKKLLDENIIVPTDNDRKVANFIFEASTDPRITVLTVNTQFHGETLYEAILGLCQEQNLGFKLILTDDDKLKFSLYMGADRSYEQTNYPYVIFSHKFENLANTNYLESIKPYKTVTLVGGEGEGSARKFKTVGGGAGLVRREKFTDASSVSSTTSGGTLSAAAYLALLEQKGLESLAESAFVRSFDGQVETTYMFKYGEEFFLGDIVQIMNEYGIEATARVTEYIQSNSLTGALTYPTFSIIQ